MAFKLWKLDRRETKSSRWFLFQRHSFFHNGALKTKTQGRFEACFVGNMKTAEENSKVPERHKNRPLEDVAVALVIKQPTGSSRGKTTVSLDTLRLCWATATVHSGLLSVFSKNCLKNLKIMKRKCFQYFGIFLVLFGLKNSLVLKLIRPQCYMIEATCKNSSKRKSPVQL